MEFCDPKELITGPIIPRGLLRKTDLTPIDKLVYVGLVDYSDGGKSWPKQITLAGLLGLQRRTIQRSLNRLEETGWIAREKSTGRAKWGHVCDRYRFPIKPLLNIAKCALEGDNGTPPSRRPRCASLGITNLNNNELKSDPAGSDGSTGVSPTVWRRFAERLAKAISNVHKINHTSQLSTWAKPFELLHRINGASIKRIDKGLAWYSAQLPLHYHDRFFLVIDSAKAFREKFNKLEVAMYKEQHPEREYDDDGSDEPTDSSGVKYTSTSRVVNPMSEEDHERFLKNMKDATEGEE